MKPYSYKSYMFHTYKAAPHLSVLELDGYWLRWQLLLNLTFNLRVQTFSNGIKPKSTCMQSKCAPIQVCPNPSVPQSKCAPIQVWQNPSVLQSKCASIQMWPIPSVTQSKCDTMHALPPVPQHLALSTAMSSKLVCCDMWHVCVVC